jgi:hypothetical protein
MDKNLEHFADRRDLPVRKYLDAGFVMPLTTACCPFGVNKSFPRGAKNRGSSLRTA